MTHGKHRVRILPVFAILFVFPQGPMEGVHAMDTAAIQALNDRHVINTYGTRKLALARGEGCRVWDAEGREYLDCFAGIAVCNLGHCHPAVTEAICEQARTLVHCSNLYYIEPQARLAELLAKHSFAPRWFFANCGATANEAAIKLARRYWAQKGTPKPHILTALSSFHGRTLAAITATGQSKFHEGFEPLVPGFTHVPYDDVAALEAAITPETGAIMLEPIQGEGGVRIPAADYLAKVRALCDKHKLLLILDEVQVGMGRTGTLFAHEQSGITPDIVTLAKALGNGVPIGAMGCTEEVSSGFSIGSHATTFGQPAGERGGPGHPQDPHRPRLSGECRRHRRLFHATAQRTGATPRKDRTSPRARDDDRRGIDRARRARRQCLARARHPVRTRRTECLALCAGPDHRARRH
jgi:acetylornithine/N-succinyldiaminopimelate aminotransferase